MVQLLPLKRMRERLNHMRLPNQSGKVFWPPLARKYLISHGKRKQGRRAGPSALAENGCGCFVPDLTRLTAPPCEEARRVYSSIEESEICVIKCWHHPVEFYYAIKRRLFASNASLDRAIAHLQGS